MLSITQLRIKVTDSIGLKLFLLYCVLKNDGFSCSVTVSKRSDRRRNRHMMCYGDLCQPHSARCQKTPLVLSVAERIKIIEMLILGVVMRYLRVLGDLKIKTDKKVIRTSAVKRYVTKS